MLFLTVHRAAAVFLLMAANTDTLLRDCKKEKHM